MKNITSSIIIGLFLGLFAVSAYGQTLSNPDVSISYTNPNNLKACGNNDTLVILVTNITALPFDAGSVLDVQLPVGISVVSFNSADYTFLTYNSLTNTYSYSMSSTQAAGSFSKIKLELSATCDIFDLLDNTSGNTLDVVADLDFNYSIGGSPGILSGSTLSFNIAQANIKTTVSAFNLTITVPNDYDPFSQEVRYDVSGNSDLDQFFLYFELPAGLTFNQIDSVIVNGVNLSGFVNPTLISGSTYGTDLNASALGLADFSSGDVIFVYYNFSPECLTSVQLSYYSGIDCFGLPCYFDNDLGYVNLLQAPPVIDLDVLFTSTADYCNNTSEVSLTLVNADISGYTMYNPYLYLILSNLNSYSNFQVNGESVISGLPGASTGTLLFMLNNLNTSSGHVLQDYNGDGVFGEIAPGDTIIITFDLLLDSSKLADCPGSFSGNQIFGNIRYYQTNCTAAPLITTPSFSNSYSNNNFAPPSINVIGTIADGTSQTIEFCIDRFIFESGTPGIGQIVLDDEILAGANILLPCGMDLVNPTSAIWEFASGGTIPVVIGTTASGAGTLVNFESVPGQIPITSNHINGCLILETTYACDTCSSPASIFYNAYGTFENCSAIHNWSCETISFCTDCEAVVDCSALGRINHTGFEVNRTSFGWTSSAMTTKLTQSNVDINPGLYNTAGAYACDTIRVLLEGVVCGGVDSFTPSIAYEKPAGVTGALLDLANAQININGTITGTTVVSSVDMGTFWLIEFETESGPFVDATTLELEAFFVVSKPVISGTPFPFHLISEITGAFFTDTPWVGGASPSGSNGSSFEEGLNDQCLYPRLDFNFYKVLPYIFEPTFSLNCGTNSEIPKLYLGYQGGTSGDEFPNEFRPFSIFLDSLVYELTNPANIGNVFVIGASISSTPLTVSQTGAFITIEPTTGTWPVYDKNSFTNYYQLEMLIEVNCENAGPVTLFDNYVHYDKFIYSDGACNEEVALTSSIIHPFSSPNLNFSFLNPVQDAFSPTTEFDFNVANLSSFSANYPYMLITYDPAVVSVTVPSFTSYAWSPGQLYVEITGVPAFTTLTDFISVSPLNCDVEQITEVVVESGYHCTGYPTSPGSFISGDYCPDQTDTLQLTILRSNLNVDLFTSFSPSEPVDHCDGKFSVVLQIYNDEKANITDLELQHPSTPGLTLLSTSYHYPIQTGEYFDPGLFAWSMVDPMDYLLIPGATSSAINSGYGFYNDGLDAQATLNGFLSNDGINLYNFYHVKLDFQVDCDYDISTPLQFEVSGLTNCGEPISIDLSTLIDFIPPIDNLQISMEISPTACESIDKTPDVFVEVLNSDTVAYDSLYVELFCDTDDNGIFDPFIDLFLSSQLLLVSGSTILNPGEIAMASFPASVSSSCPNGVYIATIANQNGCYCNYNHVIDTVDCCECAIVPSVSSVTHVVREIINMGAADQIRYALIGYPSAISNLTGNPYDPALYVYDLSVDAWIYPNQFNPPCLFFAFDMSWDSIFFQYNTDDVPLPHLIETKLVYPDVDQQGDTCETNLPICTGPQLKFDCPTCYVADIDTISCADTSSFLVTEEYLSFENNNDVKLISVYPNPVSENLYIKSDSKITAVRCYDSRGKLIINLELVESDEIILNLKGIACGVYFVNIVFDDGATLKEKIIKH